MRTRWVMAGVFVVAALLPRPASAALCELGTLQDYIDLASAGCQIDDKLFSNFQYLAAPYENTVLIPASEINVTPVTTVGNPGLQFSASLAFLYDEEGLVGVVASAEAVYSFAVDVLPGGGAITASSLLLSDFDAVGVHVMAWLFDPSGADPFASLNVSKNVSDQFTDTDTFEPRSRLLVLKEIELVDAVAGETTAFDFTLQFLEEPREVPEPGGLLLLGSGLAGWAGLAWRRRHRRK